MIQSSAFQPPFIFLCLAVDLGHNMSLLRSDDFYHMQNRAESPSMVYQVFHSTTSVSVPPYPSKPRYVAEKGLVLYLFLLPGMLFPSVSAYPSLFSAIGLSC